MSVYFVRHGESVANAMNIFSRPDTPLTDNGRKQAYLLGEKLTGHTISLIISSPDLRALETAEIISKTVNYKKEKTVIIDELHERRFGHIAGTPRKPDRYYAYTFDIEKGAETRQDLIDRMHTVLVKLKEEISGLDGDVLIIGHAVSGYYLREIILGKTQFSDFSIDYHVANASLSELKI